jgi:hypothetical protein
MDILKLEGTENTPHVTLDKSHGIFEISGRSLCENAAEFYGPVVGWLRTYAGSPNPVTDFVFKMDYINMASSRSILDVISALEGIAGAKIHWCFQEEDEDMEETGEAFAELVRVPFEFTSL